MSEGGLDRAPDAYEVVPQSEVSGARRRWYARLSVATAFLALAGVVVFQLCMKQTEIIKVGEHEPLKDGLIQEQARDTDVNYGDMLWIQNQYSGNQILERNSGVKLTTDKNRLKSKSSAWKIKCVSKWGCPSCVQYGDLVVIENQYPGLQMLQRDSGPKLTTDKSRVTINAAVWKILGTDFKGQHSERQGCIKKGAEVLIRNEYRGLQLLQRNGGPKLSTDTRRSLGNKAAVWKMISWNK